MNPKTTGILFVVAAALAAFVYLYEIEGAQDRKEAEEASKRLFGGIEQESIDKVSLQTTDGVAVELQRVDDGWRITSPIEFPADGFVADGIASALTSIQSESTIEDSRPPGVYGLGAGEETSPTPPKQVIRFVAGGVERTLSIGNKTPVGSNVYAAVDGDDSVYIVASHRTTAFGKTFDDLREKRIARFDTQAVRKIRLSWPDGDDRAGVAIEKTDQGWQLVEPIQGPADETTVDDLLSTLSTLRANGFIDDPDEQVSMDSPVFIANIELEPEEGGEARVIEVALGGVSADGSSRIVRGAETALYEIPLATTEDFPTRLDRYRFRQLAEFSSLDASRVEMGFLTPDGETIAITAKKSDDGWSATPDAFAEGKLAAMVTELSRLRADTIIADELGPDELAAIGLDPPRVSLAVYAEGADEPLAEIRLGTSRPEGIPAQVPDNPIVFQLAPKVGDAVPLSYEALTSRFLAPPAPAAPPTPDPAAGEAAQ